MFNTPPFPTDPEATIGFRLGVLLVEPGTGEISGPAGREQVDPKVMAVLVALARSPGELLTRTQLLKLIWPGSNVYDAALTQCVYQLRQHLSVAGGSRKYRKLVETFPKRGYLLRCEVLPLDSSPPTRSANARPAAWRTAGFVALFLLALGTWWLQHRALETPAANPVGTPVTSPLTNSIAVLPLLNMSAIADNAFFAGGVHEEILTNLSHINGLRVVSRTTALRYMGSDLSLRDIGRELGVRYIVEGSVRRIGNHVRIAVQLIDADDDAHLWANNYDRELVDVFATQSEVARQITNSLHLEIQPGTVGALDDMPTRSVKAYDRYLKAKSIDRSEFQAESSLRLQRELLEAAIAEDPNFVEAWGFLNDILDETARMIILNDWFGETEAVRETNFAEIRAAARRALQKAVALDPDNIETLLAQASDFVAEQENVEFRRGRKSFIDRAIELEPDSAVTWYVLAWWHRTKGETRLATPAFLKALELDPLHARIVAGSLYHFRSLGDREMTTRLFERLTQIAPETGKDKTLVEISSFARLNNLIAPFGETADESIIESYAAEFTKATGTFDFQIEETWSKVILMQLQNDLDGLLNLKIGALPENPDLAQVIPYFLANDVVLAAQRLAGRSEDAAATAMRMLDARMNGGYSTEFSFIDRFTVAAHVTLADEDKISETQRSLLNEEGGLIDDYHVLGYIGLSRLDLDRAVELLLEQKAQHPAWYGTDMAAMAHIWSRHLITHPDMQAFYVDEGKWVDYLAARVPEYARYK